MDRQRCRIGEYRTGTHKAPPAEPLNMAGFERARTGYPDDARGDVDRISSEALRPAALMVGILFVVFAVENWLPYPPHARRTVVLYNIGLAVLGFALYGLFRRITLSARGTHIAAAVLSLAVLG